MTPRPSSPPTSVVSNWVGESRRFAPGLTVNAVTDTLARSGRTIEEVAGADVVVTTYTLFRLEADAYRTVAWAGLILDEAQYVKNHQAKTYRCVRELDAPFKLAMTGTPMENNLMELWSLLSITAPGLFPDPKRFAEQYARPIERGGDAERLARLRRRIRPLLKRRTKELVAAYLPARSICGISCSSSTFAGVADYSCRDVLPRRSTLAHGAAAIPVRHRGRRRRDRRPGGRARADPAPSPRVGVRARARSGAGYAPDGTQLGRGARGRLLHARLAEGAPVRGGRARAVRLL
jgi:hypothetical protein